MSEVWLCGPGLGRERIGVPARGRGAGKGCWWGRQGLVNLRGAVSAHFPFVEDRICELGEFPGDQSCVSQPWEPWGR